MNDGARGASDDVAKREVLRARGRRLAQVAERPAEDCCLELLEFTLSYENYAFETVYVREVCPLHDLTPVPCTPLHVCGIVNLRGQILAVLDIKRLFGLPDTKLVDRHHIIVLRKGQDEIGVLADAVCGVRSVPLRDIQPSLPTLTGRYVEYLRGITTQPLVILDAARLIGDQRLVVYEEVAR